MEFKSQKSSRSIKTVTYLTLLLFPGILSFTFVTGGFNQRFVLVAILFLTILIVTYSFRPTKYRINSDELIVVMSFLSKKYTGIESVEDIDEVVKFKNRIFGIGGLFSLVGRFQSSTGKSLTTYLTNETKGCVVLVKLKNGKEILSARKTRMNL